MAIQRLSNTTTTTMMNRGNAGVDDNDESSSSLNQDLNISINSSNGNNSRKNGRHISSSPLSKSRTTIGHDVHQELHTQRLSSNTSHRRQPGSSSCGSHRTIVTATLLGCVGFLSYTLNWNSMVMDPQRQQSTLLPFSIQEQRKAQNNKLSLIPSVDELQVRVSSQPLRDLIITRQKQVASYKVTTESPEESEEESGDEIVVTKPASTDIDYSLHRPPLSTIINKDYKIIGDPEWLLDFAILGYGKCGTSTMMHWLREHPEIQAFGREKGHFMGRKPGLMIRQLYENLEPGPYQRGYKAPQDVTQVHILDYYRKYWPRAKFILGIRHPVRWFESLYNFRIQNAKNVSIFPHPLDLIGPCRQGRFLTCTNKGDFAYSLLKLGQQNYPVSRPATELELAITSRYNRTVPFDTTAVEYMYNPIFLFELEQLGDSNMTRNDLFRSDFTKFMGLKEPLPALPHYIPGMKRETEEQTYRDTFKIKICDDEYIPVRKDLMSLARKTSQWIREVFLNGPTVHVSSKEYFLSIMDGWMRDPCDDVPTSSSTTADVPIEED